MKNPNNHQPFTRICFVIIGFVTVVYVSLHLCRWTVIEVMEIDPAMFIFLNFILFIVNITLLFLSIDEARDYIKG